MNNKLSLVILSVSIGLLCTSFGLSFAQNTTTPQQEPILADPGAAAVGTIGLAGAATALVTSIINDRKQKKNVKGTDVDFATAIILLSKIIQVAYEVDPYWKKILDTRVTSNVLDKETLGEAFTTESTQWANFIQEAYNVPRPSMSVPNPNAANAQVTQETTQSKTDDTKPKT